MALRRSKELKQLNHPLEISLYYSRRSRECTFVGLIVVFRCAASHFHQLRRIPVEICTERKNVVVSPQPLGISPFFLHSLCVVVYYGRLPLLVDCQGSSGSGRIAMVKLPSAAEVVRILRAPPRCDVKEGGQRATNIEDFKTLPIIAVIDLAWQCHDCVMILSFKKEIFILISFF